MKINKQLLLIEGKNINKRKLQCNCKKLSMSCRGGGVGKVPVAEKEPIFIYLIFFLGGGGVIISFTTESVPASPPLL